MNMKETKVKSEYVFRGRIMNVRVDDALLPNGKPCNREVCEHLDGVAVLPIDDDRTVTLVRQWRYPYDCVTLEIPAGKMDRGAEESLTCGRRELEEETGLHAAQMIPLGEIWPSPGFMDEHLYLYCAKGLTQGETHPDDDEFLEIVKMPFEELCQRIGAGEVCDAKTVAAVGKALILGL